jgi:hypothetical protein
MPSEIYPQSPSMPIEKLLERDGERLTPPTAPTSCLELFPNCMI